MFQSGAGMLSLGPPIALSLVLGAALFSRGRLRIASQLRYLWALSCLVAVADLLSFWLALWLFALLSFVALREFFSLVDIRLQDRWGILAAYASIGFMTWFIHIDWYGMFVISIPVYAFTVIPLLVALGGSESEGTVFSLGAINVGLFVFVFCMGHLAYLVFFSVPLASMFLISAAYCDLVYRKLPTQRVLANVAVALLGTVALLLLTMRWTGLPMVHVLGLGIVVPVLALGGNFTMRVVEDDLCVNRERLEPGRGLLLDSLKGYLFPAPIAFHYLRWFLHWGDR